MLRSAVYDALLLRLTSRWYAEVLERVPEGAAVLDVGVGNASALTANADRVKSRRLRITGIDIDPDYIERAQERVSANHLDDAVDVRLESVYDHQGGPYDAVYFSASFMLLPEPERALRHCCGMLSPGGRIVFTQSIQLRPSRLLERLKPMLKRFTSVDFGRVTYEKDLRAQIHTAGLEVEEFTTLTRHGSRTSCLAVARPLPEQDQDNLSRDHT
jgi:2-polyprenyl-3-methyl-5-hydroxy-6-metoxy-1,4-benzoquinol methylase